MKKVLVVLLTLFGLFSCQKVLAQNVKLTLKRQANIYYARTGGTLPYKSSQFSIYMLGDDIAYCIEPSKNITTYNYKTKDGYIDLNYSDELKEKIELIGYYGREYPGHDDVKYSMAAQALIWEVTSGQKVTFWTKRYEEGNKIDITKERNEIMNLVNNHKKVPSFKEEIKGYINKEIVLTDENNLLNNFVVSNDSGNSVLIKDNKLYITPKKTGNSEIILKRVKYDDKETLVFVGSDKSSSQMLGRLRFSKDVSLSINLKVEGAKIKINKVDENENKLALSNIEFKIKNVDTGNYICETNDCIFKTDANGEIITNNFYLGNYQIEEVSLPISGYYLSKNNINISINDDSKLNYDEKLGNYIQVDFMNKKVKGLLKIKKVGERLNVINDNIQYTPVNLENILFAVYNLDNKKIGEVVTDKNGDAKIDNLEIGKYYLQEESEMENYLSNKEKYYFEIKQENSVDAKIEVNLEIANYLKKGTLEFSKTDLVTSEGIPDTIIEIYDDNDNLLLTRKTDEQGKVIIPNLVVGKYYIIEKEANSLYKITDEIVYFEIKENGEIVKASMTNEKIKGSLELIKVGETYKFINEEIIYKENLLSNVSFLLYDDSNKLIDIIKTDKNGYVKYANLPLGKYYLVEKDTPNGYLKENKKYYFEIENNKSLLTSLKIKNYLIKGDLEFSKLDLVTSEGIPNTIIEIYDDKNNLIFTKETDEEGKVIIPNLPYGKYYIIEKEANSLYMITNEKVFFEIKENGKIVKAKMTNEKIEVKVPKTSRNDHYYVASASIFLLLIGLGRTWYEKKYEN